MAVSEAVVTPEKGSGGFNPKVMLWAIGAAIIAFVGFLILTAYAPEMKQDQQGRGHALSNSAIGYSGIVQLRERLGRKPKLIRDEKGLETYDLVVATPELGDDAEVLQKFIKERGDRPTLIVLPKRAVSPDFGRPGWVRGRDIVGASEVEDIIEKVVKLKVVQRRANGDEIFYSDWAPPATFGKGAVVQTIESEKLEPYITDETGRILVGGVISGNEDEDYTPIYILSDPDVLNNLGIGDIRMAEAGNGILDGLANEKTKAVDFDVTLNGFKRSRSLLKLAFEPPFLALSVCLFIAALMALLNGLMRFGPPLQEKPAVAPGKEALVANTADLLKLAELEHEVGGRYAALARDSAAQALGLPPAMSADVVTERLDRISGDGAKFSALMAEAEQARSGSEMVGAARALYKWRREKTG